MRGRALAVALVAAVVAGGAACGDEEESFPVATAAPSRHGALREALVGEARGFAQRDGDWLEDLGDAPAFGLAVLARRADLAPEEVASRDAAVARARRLLAAEVSAGDAVEEQAMAAFGLLEHVAAARGRGEETGEDAARIEGFLDRVDALVRSLGDDLAQVAATSAVVRERGPVVATAAIALLHARAALVLGGPRAPDRVARAVALEERLYATAFADLADPGSGRSARAFAAAPGLPGLTLLPNAMMLLLETRLFRLTRDERYRLGARALFAAVQPLARTTPPAPARWAEPESASPLGEPSAREPVTLATQSFFAVALLAIFEVTGDARFVSEVDRILDEVESLRGPWCRSQLGEACAPSCGAGEACTGGACSSERCATGLLHHAVDGRLAAPGGPGRLFCSGCSFAAAFAVGLRREAAREAF